MALLLNFLFSVPILQEGITAKSSPSPHRVPRAPPSAPLHRREGRPHLGSAAAAPRAGPGVPLARRDPRACLRDEHAAPPPAPKGHVSSPGRARRGGVKQEQLQGGADPHLGASRQLHLPNAGPASSSTWPLGPGRPRARRSENCPGRAASALRPQLAGQGRGALGAQAGGSAPPRLLAAAPPGLQPPVAGPPPRPVHLASRAVESRQRLRAAGGGGRAARARLPPCRGGREWSGPARLRAGEMRRGQSRLGLQLARPGLARRALAGPLPARACSGSLACKPRP